MEMTRFHTAKILALFSTRIITHQMDLPSNEQLGGGASNPDSVEHLVQIVRHKTVTRPLREPPYGYCSNDPPPVPWSLHESQPADVFVHYTPDITLASS